MGRGPCARFSPFAVPLARNGVLTVSSIIFLVSWGEFLYGIIFMMTPDRFPLSALFAQQPARSASIGRA